ncbi:hypothetical protein Tco_0728923 [Tanacetum coccineum]|uniref:Uncharacterized protein n=1 Tax=Tanacetum coccineum TaxID=301880 RepID=A0ABQ4YQ55_9ASTR
MNCIEEIAKDTKVIEIDDQLLVLIKRQVETELMLEEKFRDLCEKVSNFVKEIEDVVKEVERLNCKDVAKETIRLLRRGQKRELYKMTRLQMMVNESHFSVREKHTLVLMDLREFNDDGDKGLIGIDQDNGVTACGFGLGKKKIPWPRRPSVEGHNQKMNCIEEIAKDAKVIETNDQLLVLIKRQVETELMLEEKFRDLRQVETELMLEEKFRDLCEEVSNFVKEIEDVVKEVERLSCKDVTKETVRLLKRGQKRELYKMTRLQIMVNESHFSVREKHTFVSKMNLGRLD